MLFYKRFNLDENDFLLLTFRPVNAMQFLSLDLFVLYLSLYFHPDVFNVKNVITILKFVCT